MTEREMLRGFEQALIDRRKQILSELEHYEEALSYLEQSRPPEFSEEAQEEAAANSLKALSQKDRRELADISLALRKIEDGTYGHCERCETAIDQSRLTALPMVRFCINCQKRLEGRNSFR
ncbi:MAG: TraR/DksA family transcriptional regulator [Acidobacteriota bacterium]|nr:MAG: TraR/DksA family transcriptional regulator [Acidobacteriota bacterium]